jgi:hypothetical protein
MFRCTKVLLKEERGGRPFHYLLFSLPIRTSKNSTVAFLESHVAVSADHVAWTIRCTRQSGGCAQASSSSSSMSTTQNMVHSSQSLHSDACTRVGLLLGCDCYSLHPTTRLFLSTNHSQYTHYTSRATRRNTSFLDIPTFDRQVMMGDVYQDQEVSLRFYTVEEHLC